MSHVNGELRHGGHGVYVYNMINTLKLGQNGILQTISSNGFSYLKIVVF